MHILNTARRPCRLRSIEALIQGHDAATSNRAHGDFSYPFGLLSCWDLSLCRKRTGPNAGGRFMKTQVLSFMACLCAASVSAGTIDRCGPGANRQPEHVGEIGALNGAPLEQPHLDIYNVNIPSPSAVMVDGP